MPSRSLSRRPGLVLLLFVVGTAWACGSQPIPLVAVEGTTISVAVPGSFPTEYGRRYSGASDLGSVPAFDPSSPWEDPQNGELVFYLYDSIHLLGHLPVRYITKVNPSPSSPSALDHSLNATFHGRGQTLAFLDVPVGLIPEDGEYQIIVVRFRRKPGSEDLSNPFEQVQPPPLAASGTFWGGWGDLSVPQGQAGSSINIPIYIKQHDGAERFTPTLGWENQAGIGVTYTAAALAPLVPYPEFEVRVPAIGSTATPPAAWEIQLIYPRDKIRIRGVSLRRAAQSEALVRWDAADPDAVVNCAGAGTNPDALTIRVVDPDQLTEGVRVAYQLRNFEKVCGARAVHADFVENPGSFKAYNADGNDVTASYSAEIDASSFF